MEKKIIQLVEILIIILIIVFSAYSLKTMVTSDLFSISFTNFQDYEFSIITKEDAISIKTAVKDGYIDYISDTKCESFCIIFQQYILAPIFINYESVKHKYAFGNFADPQKALEIAQKNNLEIIKQNKSFYLFKAKQ
jgi:hypothetical protein